MLFISYKLIYINISEIEFCTLTNIRMGFDVSWFQGEVDEELLCPICSEVLEDPLQAPSCEHAFCSECINEWLSR